MNVTCLEVVVGLSVLLFVFFYEFSQRFRFYTKFAIYYSVAMFLTALCIPLCFIKPFDLRNFVYAAVVCKHISRLIGLKWIVRGKEHLEQDRAAIIVSNHQSSVDILGMFEVWSTMKKCTVVAKKELFYAGPFGFGSWLCGMIYIDRVRSDTARNAVNVAAEIVKKKEAKLWIFAEGTRRNTGEIHPFKKGAFHMAISSQIPILPVVYSRYYFLNNKEKKFDNGKVILTTLPSISTVGMTISDIDKLMKQTHDAMSTVYHDTTKEAMELDGLPKNSS